MTASSDNRAHRRDEPGDLHETVTAIADLAQREVRRELDHAREKASEVVAEGKRRVVAASEGLADRVRERPLTSLAIAGGLGLLLGLMMRRRQ